MAEPRKGVVGTTPVYNVSLPLMSRHSPGLPVRILTLEVD